MSLLGFILFITYIYVLTLMYDEEGLEAPTTASENIGRIEEAGCQDRRFSRSGLSSL
jgi:hypothetical protein